MPRSLAVVCAAGLMLGACQTPPTSSQVTAVTTAGTTLLALAASKSTTVATLVAKGQTFCKAGSGVVALANSFLQPTSVYGETAQAVLDACGAIQAVPVPPPTSVPLDTVPVAAAPAGAPTVHVVS